MVFKLSPRLRLRRFSKNIPQLLLCLGVPLLPIKADGCLKVNSLDPGRLPLDICVRRNTLGYEKRILCR
jgi:hypothetical protein